MKDMSEHVKSYLNDMNVILVNRDTAEQFAKLINQYMIAHTATFDGEKIVVAVKDWAIQLGKGAQQILEEEKKETEDKILRQHL